MLKRRMLCLSLLMLLLGFGSAMAQGRDSEDHYELGNLAYSRGQYDRAITEYTQVLTEIGGNRSAANYNIGVCYQHMGRFDEAVQHYRAAIAMRQGRYLEASYALGVTLEQMSRLDQAKDAFLEAVRASGGSNAAATFEIALILQAQGDMAAAARTYREAIVGADKQNAASCHNNLGIVLAMSGDYLQAEREFVIAVRQSRGKLVEAKRNLALCKQLYTAPALVACLSISSTRTHLVAPAGG